MATFTCSKMVETVWLGAQGPPFHPLVLTPAPTVPTVPGARVVGLEVIVTLQFLNNQRERNPMCRKGK